MSHRARAVSFICVGVPESYHLRGCIVGRQRSATKSRPQDEPDESPIEVVRRFCRRVPTYRAAVWPHFSPHATPSHIYPAVAVTAGRPSSNNDRLVHPALARQASRASSSASHIAANCPFVMTDAWWTSSSSLTIRSRLPVM